MVNDKGMERMGGVIPLARRGSRRTGGPGGTAAWDNDDWSAWAVGLVEPLIDPEDRIATLERMRRQCAGETRRASVLLAGVICDLVDSLPGPDPWRNVDPEKFGTFNDGVDLVLVDTKKIREDIGLAALARDLEPDAVRLLAAAGSGWSEVARIITALKDPVGSGTRAISWVAWRRRAYLGVGETFPVIAVFSWLRRAQLVVSGEQIDDQDWYARTRESARIEDNEYDV